MNKKFISISLILTMLVTSLSACTNTTMDTTKTNESESSAYYSIVNAENLHSKNEYMELNIKIPKIEYTNAEDGSQFDEINTEIETTITNAIDEAKATAKETFETYLKSAKSNAVKDRTDKLNKLLDKYENILTNEDKEFLDFIINENTGNNSKKTMPKKVSTNSIIHKNISTRSNMPKGPMKDSRPMKEPNNNFANNKFDRDNNNKRPDDIPVDAFSNSSDLIIPGLHNKNIIVIETTEAETTTASSNEKSQNGNSKMGKPRKGSASNAERPTPPDGDMPEFKDGEFPLDVDFATKNNDTKNSKVVEEETTIKETAKKENTTKESTKEETTTNTKTDGKNDIIEETNATFKDKKVGDPNRNLKRMPKRLAPVSTKSNMAPTINDFYMELEFILDTPIPNDRELRMAYTPTTINCDYFIQCLDKEYLSLYIDLSTSRATSYTTRFYYNVDLNQKKILKISDILGENYKEICNTSINNSIESWTDEKKSMLSDNYDLNTFLTDDVSFFINSNHTPVVVLEKYSIAIGAAGYLEFLIKDTLTTKSNKGSTN